MNEPKKQKVLRDIKVNVKTLYRPFKQCFKHPVNTIKRIIKDLIPGRYAPIFTSIPYSNGAERIKISNSRGGSKRVRYASIKGFCKLNRQGNLV